MLWCKVLVVVVVVAFISPYFCPPSTSLSLSLSRPLADSLPAFTSHKQLVFSPFFCPLSQNFAVLRFRLESSSAGDVDVTRSFPSSTHIPNPPFFFSLQVFFSRWVITCLRLQTFHTVWRCWRFFFFFSRFFFQTDRERESWKETEWVAQKGVWTENKCRDFISARSRLSSRNAGW